MLRSSIVGIVFGLALAFVPAENSSAQNQYRGLKPQECAVINCASRPEPREPRERPTPQPIRINEDELHAQQVANERYQMLWRQENAAISRRENALALGLALERQKLRSSTIIDADVAWRRGEVAWDQGDHHRALALFHEAAASSAFFAAEWQRRKQIVAEEDQAARDRRDRPEAESRANREIAALRADFTHKVEAIRTGQAPAIASTDERLRKYLASLAITEHPGAAAAGIASPPAAQPKQERLSEAKVAEMSAQLATLESRKAKLTAALAQVQSRRTELNQTTQEFEDMRADAIHGFAWEFVDHVPIGAALHGVKETAGLKHFDVRKVEAGLEAIKALLDTGRGLTAEEEKEKKQKIFEGSRELTEAMSGLAHLDPRAEKLLDAAHKIMSIGGTLAIASSGEKMSTREKLQTTMAIVEIVQPLWGMAILVEGSAERSVQYVVAGNALTSLREAQNKSWQAEKSLRAAIAREEQEAEWLRTTIKDNKR